MAVDKDETKEAAKVTKKAAGTEEEVTVIYIGPSLPHAMLKCNRIFKGTMEAIKKEIAGVLEKYPLVERLLVPVSQLAEKKDKVKTAGNVLNKYYADILSQMAANAKEG
jgi:hypothetical protein